MEIGLKVMSKKMLQVELFADDFVVSYVTEWSVEWDQKGAGRPCISS